MRDLGAGEVIDYRSMPVEAMGGDYDAALVFAASVTDQSIPLVRRGGILISITDPATTETAMAHGIHTARMGGFHDRDAMRKIVGLVDRSGFGLTVAASLPACGRRSSPTSQPQRAGQGQARFVDRAVNVVRIAPGTEPRISGTPLLRA